MTDEPKLAGEDGQPEDTGRPARARRPRTRPVRQEGEQPVTRCPDGHEVAIDSRFCPVDGKRIESAGPPVCLNGHQVKVAGALFCPQCGIGMDAAQATESGGVIVTRPRPDAELSQDELKKREMLHHQALRLGQENPVLQFGRMRPEQGTQTTLIHFLVDGVTAFGHVWMRGQEIELWPGHPRWAEAKEWIQLDTAGQFERWGRQVFGNGPWPGARSYTAGIHNFQQLMSMSGEGFVQPPGQDELARADRQEQQRGRGVPMPIGWR